MLFIFVGSTVFAFKYGFDIGKRSATATLQNDDYNRTIYGDTVTYMGMTASSTMSIFKVRQGYDALGQTLNPADLLADSIELKKSLSPHLPTAVIFLLSNLVKFVSVKCLNFSILSAIIAIV